jgi:hypothetical protein
MVGVIDMVISKQLATNITTGSVWHQITEGAGGLAYTVPSSGSTRADVKMLRAINLSSGSAAVELAISSGSPPSSAAQVWNKHTVLGEGQTTDDSVHVMRSGEKLWARVSGAISTNITIRASLLEVDAR